MSDDNLVRIVRGHAEPHELAALTVLLLARAGARPAAESAAGTGTTRTLWRRPERYRHFPSPHSWRSSG
ncbi:acyl-CoA carboxylase epsilon subunit [Streptomyces mutabilis]|uniref:acyl-CoA carboxylase epsilon subunit n=1 Tax=Streptomyces mutabilis TaxID=67332 RepID=UPI001786CF3D|nr:acyl-CoA carboxylase epsilon subunit [Streptomyces mutabilis]GGQ47576.1 hypothetical protein GCM10010279_66550 [Streptomyces mutabilis]